MRILGSLAGTKRSPLVRLEMAEEDARKLLVICEYASDIASALEFFGLKWEPVMRVLDALKKGLAQAGIKIKR